MLRTGWMALPLLLLAACGDGGAGTSDGPLAVDLSLRPEARAPEASVADGSAETAKDAARADAGRPDAAAPSLLAGAAAVDITPGTGVPLGGFGAAPRRVISVATVPAHIAALAGFCYDPSPGDVASLFAPNKGTHDPIMARVVVLDNGKTKAALLTVDAVAISRQMRDDVEKEAVSLGIPKEHLIVSATHTHSGPAAVSNQKIWELIAMDCYHQGTYQIMLLGITSALRKAFYNRTAARVGIGATTEKRASKNRSGRPGVFDPELGLIKVADAVTGKPIAAVLNFAVHGTCNGASNMLYSADVMGETEKALEKTLGGGVAIFLNGAEGDVSPTSGGFTGAATVGGYIAETAATLWSTLATKTWIDIKGSFTDQQMPAPTLNGCMPLFDSKTSLCDILPFPVTIPIGQLMQSKLPFAALRLDDVAFAALPGEGITDIGLDIKAKGKARGFRYTFIVGLANDFMGYVTTPTEYVKGGYEAQSTMFGKDTGTLVVKHLDSELGKI